MSPIQVATWRKPVWLCYNIRYNFRWMNNLLSGISRTTEQSTLRHLKRRTQSVLFCKNHRLTHAARWIVRRFDFGMMFFGRLTYAINWLRFGRTDLADAVFNEGFLHQLGPWNVWRELATPISTGGGAVNFLTGAGAFLQAFLYGYIGVNPQVDELKLHPVLPAHVANISATRLSYSGCAFAIFVNATSMEFQPRSTRGCAEVHLIDSRNITHTFPATGALTLPIGTATMRHKATKVAHIAGVDAVNATVANLTDAARLYGELLR